MNNPFARHLIHERNGLPERVFRTGQIVTVNRRADAPEGAPQAGTKLAAGNDQCIRHDLYCNEIRTRLKGSGLCRRQSGITVRGEAQINKRLI